MTREEMTERRKALRLSKTALAAALGMSRQTVSQWENGHAALPPWPELAMEGLRVREQEGTERRAKPRR